ncbi:MAG: DUF4276 family protein [Planctomycetaceae bacterium]|jgi:hypothetical protein|nr:DUF4276 family protein [Planctomycetaceae bacterium]
MPLMLTLRAKRGNFMHFEILVEDASGKMMLEQIVPKIIGPKGKPNQYRIINIQELKHRMMAQMDRQLARTLPWDKILFQTLSMQLRAYSKTQPYKNMVIVIVVDLDCRNQKRFQSELETLFHLPTPALDGGITVAVEEGEAWLFGDLDAVRRAYPLSKEFVLQSYRQDSVCGTWEFLADAVFHGGAEALTALGYPLIGREKCRWAENIAQYVDVEKNKSPSFQTFRSLLQRWADV